VKRTYAFVTPRGVVQCEIDGRTLDVPVFMGVLKHPDEDQLRALLSDPKNLRKYTVEALRKLPWSALRRFPRGWLHACLQESALPEGRRKAIEFMLDT
jgi:hypothetical protein